jgi:hypothetical protein
VPHIEEYISPFAGWIVYADLEIFSFYLSFAVDEIFTPLVKRCSQLGVSTLERVLHLELYDRWAPNEQKWGSIEQTLDVCIEADLNNGLDVPSQPAQVAFLKTVSKLFDYGGKLATAYGIRILESWIDRMDASVGSHFLACGILESVLEQPNVEIFTDLSLLLERMVRRGFHISDHNRDNDFCTQRANIEARELYFEAFHVFGAKLH